MTSTAEAFVIDTKTWLVAYHGPVEGAGKANLSDALAAVVAGKKPEVAEAAVKGAPIAFPDRAKAAEFAKISYAKEVAPILEAKCVACHTEGGIGPFAMNSYEMVKGFSPMIREVLRTKRMPPFHADPHYGAWKNDKSLSADADQDPGPLGRGRRAARRGRRPAEGGEAATRPTGRWASPT